MDLYWRMLSGDVLYYDLILKTASGEKVPLVTMLRGKPESRWIMEQLRLELFPPLVSVDRGCQKLDRFADGALPQLRRSTSRPVQPTPRDSPIVK